MLRVFILLGSTLVVHGSYTYRPAATPVVTPATANRPAPVASGTASRVTPSVLPPPPPNFVANDFSHNISFVITGKGFPSKTFDTIDPYFKVYETSLTIIEPFKFGTTEIFNNNPNPEFATVLSYSWKRGTNQTLIFKLKDSDTARDNDISEAKLEADSFAAKGFKANLSLSTGGTILVQKTAPIKFRLYARNLPRMDPGLTGSGKSDPFVKCYWRRGARGEERKFYTTATITDVENPDWNETIEFPNYIKGTDLWLVFKVRDSDGVNKDDDLGETVLELDPYVEKRQTKIMRLGKDGQSSLGITPTS